MAENEQETPAIDRSVAQTTRAIGRELVRARDRLGISQQQLAQRSGVGQSTVSRMEAGARLPGLATLRAVARTLRLEADIVLRPAWSDEVAFEVTEGRWARWAQQVAAWRGVSALAIGGALGAALHGLRVAPDAVDVVVAAGADHLDRLLYELGMAGMVWMHPDGMSAPFPDAAELAPGTHTFTDAYVDIRVTCTGPLPERDVVTIGVRGTAVPVLLLRRIVDTDPWVARVWQQTSAGSEVGG